MCPKCGSNTICDCFNYDPFCTNCFKEKDCEVKYNAKCVVYNYNDPYAINKLTCLGLPNGVSVHTFMERVDQEFCFLKSCEFVDYILDKIKTCTGLQDKLCDLTCDCDCTGNNCTAAYIISGGTLPAAVTSSAYTHTITLGGTSPFTLANIVKPSWLTLTVVGNQIQFTGTPVVAGTVTVSFDINNCDDSFTYPYTGSITIASSCIAPYTISGGLPDGVANSAYSAAYQFGGTQTMTLAIQSKPSWMSITFADHVNLLISGTPGTGDIVSNTPVHFTITNACGVVTINEVINIFDDTAGCFPPGGFEVTGVTVGDEANFTLSWIFFAGAIDQQVYYAINSVVGLTPPPAAGWTEVTGITATSTGVTINGLDTNTEYIFAIRTNCGGSVNSVWNYKKAFSLECPVLTTVSNNDSIQYTLDINHPTELSLVLSQFSVLLRDPTNGNPSTCIAIQDILPVYSTPTIGTFGGLIATHGYEVGVVFSPGTTCCPTCDDPVTFCTKKSISTTSLVELSEPCTLDQEDVVVSDITDVGFTVLVTGLTGDCQSSYDLVITQDVSVIVSLSELTGPYTFIGGTPSTEYTITVVKNCCEDKSHSDPISQVGTTNSFDATDCAWINQNAINYTGSAVMHTTSSLMSHADISIDPIPSGGSLTLTTGMVIAKCNTNCCILDCFNFPVVSRKLSSDTRFELSYDPSSGYNYQIIYRGPNTTITGDTNYTAIFSCV